MPSPSPPGAAQSRAWGRGRGDDSSLIWHRAELSQSPPAASQQASSLPGSLAQVGTSWVPPLSLGFLRDGASLERSKETCESPHSPLKPFPRSAPTPKDPPLPSHLKLSLLESETLQRSSGFLMRNTRETVNWGTCLTFPSSSL